MRPMSKPCFLFSSLFFFWLTGRLTAHLLNLLCVYSKTFFLGECKLSGSSVVAASYGKLETASFLLCRSYGGHQNRIGTVYYNQVIVAAHGFKDSL